MPSIFKRRAAAGVLAFALATAAVSQPAADDSLFRDLGGEPGLTALMDDFVPRLETDSRMQPFFKDADMIDLRHKLVLQFCDVSGGPCKTKNPDMKDTHADFRIRKSDFNALVEVLQQSMDAKGIPFGVQNRLLARLAPMHREIVNTP